MNFSERAALCKNSLAKQLLLLIDEKKTNLAFSADVTECKKLLELADLLGPEICVLKTHVDILNDFHIDFTKELSALAKKHRFLIFEDRKFADIGTTVKHQYHGGIYRISSWADIINAHSVPGPGVIEGLTNPDTNKGLLLVAEMSSRDNLTDAIYAQRTLEMAKQFPEQVIGFIAQHKLSDNPRWIYFSPGIQLQPTNDELGQQYVTPEMAINHHQSDVIIVGRGILQAKDPLAEAKKYRQAGWDAYESI